MNAQMKWDRRTPWLYYNGTRIAVTNNVRQRQMENPEDVVFSIPSKTPYMPTHFPSGVWKVGKPLPRTNPYLAPFFIPTDAWQLVNEWTLTSDGCYDKETKRQVRDEGYGIHFSTSSTTLGCLRVVNKSDLIVLAKWIAESKNEIYFEAV